MNKLVKTAILAAALLLPLSAAAQEMDWKSVTRYNKAEAKKQLTERFTKYVTFDTQSSDQTAKVPSTAGQTKLAKALAKLKKGSNKVRFTATSTRITVMEQRVNIDAPHI